MNTLVKLGVTAPITVTFSGDPTHEHVQAFIALSPENQGNILTAILNGAFETLNDKATYFTMTYEVTPDATDN